jgi:GNAT superfamily N-acetyltransferase
VAIRAQGRNAVLKRGAPLPVIEIRAGAPGDLPALARVEREAAAMFPASILPPELAQPVPAAQLAAAIDASLLWVAHEVAQDPAHAAVGFVVCERRGACLHIVEMDVLPRFGRKGIGRQLLLHACDAAAKVGLQFVTLTTFAHLPWNAPFYAKHGFTITRDLVQFPHLQAALVDEATRGLRARVAMVRPSA